jgi:AraC-like DNA-binding protein
MDFQFSTIRDGFLVFRHEVPPEHQYKIIKGSEVFYAGGDFGEVLLQKIKAEQQEAWQLYLRILQDITFRITYPGPVVIAHFRLENELLATWDGSPSPFMLPQGQFNIYYSGHLDILSTFHKGLSYQSLNLIIQPPFFEKNVLESFPFLRPFLASMHKKQSFFLLTGGAWFTLKVHDILNSILHNCFTPEQVSKHFNVELSRLALILLWRTDKLVGDRSVGLPVIPDDHPGAIPENIRKVKEIIDTAFPATLTLQTIQQRSGISSHQIRTGFPKYYHLTAEQYSTLSKMHIALKWLQEGQQVKVVMANLGYRNSGHFARLFKETFGIFPGEVAKIIPSE